MTTNKALGHLRVRALTHDLADEVLTALLGKPADAATGLRRHHAI